MDEGGAGEREPEDVGAVLVEAVEEPRLVVEAGLPRAVAELSCPTSQERSLTAGRRKMSCPFFRVLPFAWLMTYPPVMALCLFYRDVLLSGSSSAHGLTLQSVAFRHSSKDVQLACCNN